MNNRNIYIKAVLTGLFEAAVVAVFIVAVLQMLMPLLPA